MLGTHKIEIWDISNLTQALGHALIFDHFHMDENFNNFSLNIWLMWILFYQELKAPNYLEK